MIAAVAIAANYTDRCELCSTDADAGARAEPPEHRQQCRAGQADAAVRRPAGVGVQEDGGPAAGHDRGCIECDERELAVGDRLAPERLAAAVKRGRRPAGDVAEAVVRRRGRVTVPPVAAPEAV